VTFYESNRDVERTGAEVDEFVDATPARDSDDDPEENVPGSHEPPRDE
jgi:hypothetical protein